MKEYNDEYYIIFDDNNEYQMDVKIHLKSSNRHFDYQKLLPGEPLFFEPGFQERNERSNIVPRKTDMMSEGLSFIVSNPIHKILSECDLQGMQLYPSVIIEDDDSWDESYWYLNIWQDLDCWDRKMSIARPLKADMEERDTVIKQYFLDSKVLDNIPEEKRLIFRMGEESNGYIFMHQKLVDIFRQNNFTGVRFFKVSEFKSGMQL
jgi:hypothetical protein